MEKEIFATRTLPKPSNSDITRLSRSDASQVTIVRIVKRKLLTAGYLIATNGTYAFSLFGPDNIPRKPVVTVMHDVTSDPAVQTLTGVSLSCKAIDIFL